MTSNSPSIGRLAVRNTVWLTILSYAAQFIAFGATIILTRFLGPKVFGLLAIGLFWSSLLSLRSKLGLTQASIRQPELNGELLGTYYVLDLSVTGLSLILGVGLAVIFSQTIYGSEPTVGLIIVVMLIVESLPALVNPLGLALERELQLSRLTLVYLVSTIISYALAIILALVGAGLWSLLGMNIANAIITLVGTYVVCRWRLPQVFHLHWRFSRPMARRLLKQGVPMGLANMGTTNIVNQYDNFLIGTFVNPTMLGFYDRAYRLSQWPNVLLTQVLSRVGFITFARVQNDLPRLTHAMRLSLWVITTLGVPIALMLAFGASEVVEILYGPAWFVSSFFLRFLAVYTLFSPFISLAGSLAYALGNIRMTVWITGAQVITILSVATFLTLAFGAVGTVLGVGVTVAIGFVISTLYIFRRLPLSARATFGAPLLAVSIASAVTLFVMSQSGWHELTPLIRLIIIGCTSSGLYLISVVVLDPQEMLARVRYVTRTFRGTPTA
ncbi:Lipopolysaccharide biosynthesis protein WzxC [Thermoflexales bacterium]|nr:Lipopolysaccharide biosynthesis protein WzxC [Thermoflexales bacterium]